MNKLNTQLVNLQLTHTQCQQIAAGLLFASQYAESDETNTWATIAKMFEASVKPKEIELNPISELEIVG